MGKAYREFIICLFERIYWLNFYECLWKLVCNHNYEFFCCTWHCNLFIFNYFIFCSFIFFYQKTCCYFSFIELVLFLWCCHSVGDFYNSVSLFCFLFTFVLKIYLSFNINTPPNRHDKCCQCHMGFFEYSELYESLSRP